ncbi:ATP-dependent DNA helicase Q1-like [Corticium candelabrum]|uniref:ATP-dependent DNA helicase Q1-like n=1 Tax=Corticium candelabrum TaxID=121492 RepID=UPI002E2648A7|nr:ATP-dependent DNA helicase Q1-like [Corticium candelabrum]
MAMTATAPSKMLREISQFLCMTRKVLVSYPLDRPNIFLYAKKTPQSQKAILSLLFGLTSLESFPKTIVYVQRKVKAVKLWQCLSSRGLQVGLHHSSLRADTSRQVEMQFKTGKILVVIATIGFSMGIDIPDVHMVVNLGLPSTIEEWFQEEQEEMAISQLQPLCSIPKNSEKRPRTSASTAS